MKNLLIAVIGLLIFVSCERENRQNDLKEYNLYDRVKSLKEFSYEGIEKFGEISKGDRKRISGYDLNLNFDSDGNIIEKILFKSDGSLFKRIVFTYTDTLIQQDSYDSSGEILSKEEKLYNYEGRLIEVNYYDSAGNLKTKHKFKYGNRHSDEIKKVIYDSSGVAGYIEEYDYDDRGKRILSNGFNAKGEIVIKIEYEYDLDGNLIKKQEHNTDGKIVSKYDENGNEIEWFILNNNGEMYDRWKQKYDNKNNMIEWVLYENDGSKESSAKFDYEFDERGNWIQKLVFNPNKTYIYEREIEYYE